MHESMKLKQRIKFRVDVLQHWMEENYHMSHPEVVHEHIQLLTKFWSMLSEEDQTYIESAQFAVDGKLPWG